MPLTNMEAQKAKPKDKPYKLADGEGMYLYVASGGAKYWRLNYRFNGKEKTLTLGVFPDVSLAAAREKRDAARKLLGDGIDPAEEMSKKGRRAAAIAKMGNTFEIVAREWFEKFTPTWEPEHAKTIIRRLERDVFPWLGKLPVGEIEPPSC